MLGGKRKLEMVPLHSRNVFASQQWEYLSDDVCGS